MKKEQIETCKEILNIFNNMYFKELSTVDMIKHNRVFNNFAKMIMDAEKPQVLEQKTEMRTVKGTTKKTKKVKKNAKSN